MELKRVHRSILLAGSAGATLVAGSPALAADPPGEALLLAAMNDDSAIASSMIEQGAAIDTRHNDGSTALLWAAFYGNSAVVEALLERGADPDLANDLGITPLIQAAKNHDSGLVAKLLKAGADPNLATWSGETAAMYLARAGDAENLAAVLKSGVEVDQRDDRFGQTALMWAADAGQTKTVEVLLEHGADPNAATPIVEITDSFEYGTVLVKVNRGGFTPLLFAANSQSVETAQMLLDAGAEINLPAADGTTPLIMSLFRHVNQQHLFPRDTETVADLAMARLLLDQGADPNAATAVGMTPLMAAVFVHRGYASRGDGVDDLPHPPHPEMGEAAAKLLLAHGADPNPSLLDYRVPTPSGADAREPARYANLSAVTLASVLDRPAMVRLLLESDKFDLEARDRNAETPLMAAVRLNSAEGVEALLDAGADVDARNAQGQTALHLASTLMAGGGKVAQALIEAGADLSARDGAGRTPLDLAKAAGTGDPGDRSLRKREDFARQSALVLEGYPHASGEGIPEPEGETAPQAIVRLAASS